MISGSPCTNPSETDVRADIQTDRQTKCNVISGVPNKRSLNNEQRELVSGWEVHIDRQFPHTSDSITDHPRCAVPCFLRLSSFIERYRSVMWQLCPPSASFWVRSSGVFYLRVISSAPKRAGVYLLCRAGYTHRFLKQTRFFPILFIYFIYLPHSYSI